MFFIYKYIFYIYSGGKSKHFKSVLFNKKMEKTFFRRDFVNVVEVAATLERGKRK